MTRVAVIVAMERELHPLVDGWARKSFDHEGKAFDCFESGDCVALAGGIGCRCAEQAARAVMAVFHPQTLISAGLGGALVEGLRAGMVVHPDVVIDVATGIRYGCPAKNANNGGVLVSSSEIVGPETKDRMAERFNAQVVDMEAAGVAKVAQELNAGFHCVKAVSDEYDLALPPLNRFVDQEGNFQAARFGAWAAFRPWHWPAILRLAYNTGRATRALSAWLRKNLNDNVPGPTIVTLSAGHIENANANCQQS
jgi:adenosylhomocysteine nucleosidase